MKLTEKIDVPAIPEPVVSGKPPDVLLIQPPISDFYLTAKRTIPYGLACIAAALIRDGFSVEIFDAMATSKSRPIKPPDEMKYLEKYYIPDVSPFSLFSSFRRYGYSDEHIGNIVKSANPFLVGISSLFTAYADEAIRVAEIVRRNCPDSAIVMGGHHATAFPEKVMENRAVDFVIRGEGEPSLPLLVQALKTGGRFETVPGIVFRNDDGTLHISPQAMMENPDNYPLPALHLVRNSFYRRGKFGSAVIVGSRGCPMKCSYCAVGSSPLKYRRRSVAHVISELELAVIHHNARYIDFEDENLSLNRQWFLTLLYEIGSRFSGLDLELRAMNGLYPPSLDEEMICAMKTAGFRILNLSVGTLNEAQMKRFNRPQVKDDLENVIRWAGKYDMECVCYIIAGSPGQSAMNSLDDLLVLAAGSNVLIGVSIFYPAPGSPDYEQCERKRLLPDSFPLMRSSALPIDETTTRTEAVTLLRLARILNFMKSLRANGGRKNRTDIGKQLLELFLIDGKIRGISPEGKIYEHLISTDLTTTFLRKVIQTLRVFKTLRV